jgi:hypothetical protein
VVAVCFRRQVITSRYLTYAVFATLGLIVQWASIVVEYAQGLDHIQDNSRDNQLGEVSGDVPVVIQ